MALYSLFFCAGTFKPLLPPTQTNNKIDTLHCNKGQVVTLPKRKQGNKKEGTI